MPNVGVTVQTRTAPPAGGAPANTGNAFLVAVCGGTANVPVLCQSIADFESTFGVRAAGNQAAWDWCDVYFREGGNQVYVTPYTTTLYNAAFSGIDPQLGPGQLALIGITPTAQVFTDMANLAISNNMVAIADVPATATTETTTAAVAAFLPTAAGGDYIGCFGSWLNVPGPAGYTGVPSRSVPASAAICAMCNRIDISGNPNRAAAGRDFPLQYSTGFAYAPNTADRNTLMGLNINMFKNVYGVLEGYGFRSAVPQTTQSPFWQLNCARARMWMKFQAQVIGEKYAFKSIDAAGHAATALQAELNGMLLELYNADGLYGVSPGDAFDVNVGVTVNTTASAAAGQLNAVVQARLSQAAESVLIELVSVPVSGTVVQSGGASSGSGLGGSASEGFGAAQ